jgi:hypothetical protein
MKMPTPKDLRALRDSTPTPILLNGAQMFQLLAVLQLALRHPELNGPTADMAFEFACKLQERIIAIAPGCRDLCAAGWKNTIDELEGTMKARAV